MTMLRALFALIILMIAGRVLGALFRSLTRTDRAGAGQVPERMVRCARCSTFIPASEALEAGGSHFCCQEHRDLGPSEPA